MSRAGWLVLIALAAVIVFLFSTGRVGGNSNIVGSIDVGTGTPAPAQPAPAPATTPAAVRTGGSSSPSVKPRPTAPRTVPVTRTAPATGTVDQAPGTVVVAGRQLLPLSGATNVRSDGNLSAYGDGRAVARSVRVQSVAADEGFWIGTAAGDRVWVQLTGQPPESPYSVRVGDRVSFIGKMTPNGVGFARRVGVDPSEGEARLNAQGEHIDVVKRTLVLAG